MNIDLIIRYESGEASDEETLELFSDLIKNGQAWTLQGHYGRVATDLIEGGHISRTGEILKEFEEGDSCGIEKYPIDK